MTDIEGPEREPKWPPTRTESAGDGWCLHGRPAQQRVTIEARTRRGFLRLAAGAAVTAAMAGCGSRSERAPARAATDRLAGSHTPRTLRIAQWSHFVPAYDQWFDEDYTRRWAQRTGIEVVVDHFPLEQLSTWAQAEVATQQGHDLFFFATPAAAFEDDVIDLLDDLTVDRKSTRLNSSH